MNPPENCDITFPRTSAKSTEVVTMIKASENTRSMTGRADPFLINDHPATISMMLKRYDE